MLTDKVFLVAVEKITDHRSGKQAGVLTFLVRHRNLKVVNVEGDCDDLKLLQVAELTPKLLCEGHVAFFLSKGSKNIVPIDVLILLFQILWWIEQLWHDCFHVDVVGRRQQSQV